jgi:hypothetical protein
MDQFKPLSPPEFSCGLRWDFAIEMGYLDWLRRPRAAEFYIRKKRLKPADPDRDALVELMNACRLATHVPRWTFACSAWWADESCPTWLLTNGDEWMRVVNEGLWSDMLQRITGAGLAMARIVAPRTPRADEEVMFGDIALLHDANTGRLSAYPTNRVRYWVQGRARDRITHN